MDEFLTADQRASVRTPIDQALTLPRSTFISSDFFDMEVERIFSRNWMAVCFDHAIAGAGDVLPMEILGMPMVAVRGLDERVRVFHNICPYDGCPVALEPRSTVREIVSPYHGWRYDLKGVLRAVPYWDGSKAGDLNALGERDGNLVEIRSANKLGVVFINLGGGAAPSITEHLAPLRALLEDYRIDGLVAVADDESLLIEGRTVRANWKTYLENAAINILHESFTHASYHRSTEVPRVKDGQKTHVVHLDGPLMAFGYQQSDVQKTYPPLGLPHIGRSPERAPENGYFLTLYPNLVIPVMPEMIRINICLPINPERTKLLHCGFFHPDAPTEPSFDKLKTLMRAGFHEAYREDRVVIEAVQRARRSPVCDQQFYAPFWDEQHHHLNNLILDDLERGKT